MPLSCDRIGARLSVVMTLLVLALVIKSAVVLNRMGIINDEVATVHHDRVVPMQQLQSAADGYFRGMMAGTAGAAKSDIVVQVKGVTDLIRGTRRTGGDERPNEH